MRKLIAAFLVALASATHAASGPYDEAADAMGEIRTALAQPSQPRKPVLVVFGANWCGDCKVLDIAFKEGQSARLVSAHFQVVKVDVGKFDHNTDIAESYGVPLKKGIPAIAVLAPTGKVLYVTKAGELADARNMGEKGIYEFLARVSAVVRR
jgi:thioredoxin 1